MALDTLNVIKPFLPDLKFDFIIKDLDQRDYYYAQGYSPYIVQMLKHKL